MSWDDDAESSADELTHTTLTRAFRSSRAAEKAALDEFVAVERAVLGDEATFPRRHVTLRGRRRRECVVILGFGFST